MSDLGDDFFVDLWEEVQYVVKRKIQNAVDEKCTEMRGYYRALLKERDDTIAELENDSKPVRKKQKKKERPMHNHDPGEKPKEPCEHCIRWGDTLDFTMPGGPEYTIVPTGDGIKSFPTSEISKIELTDLRTGKRITVDEAWEIHKKHKAKPDETEEDVADVMNRLKRVVEKKEETENTKPKKGGRPKGSKNKPKAVPVDEKPTDIKVKKGGRPKGSKNKPKSVLVDEKPKEVTRENVDGKVKRPLVMKNKDGTVRVCDFDYRTNKRVETMYSSYAEYEKSRETIVVKSKDGTVRVWYWDSRLNVRIMTTYDSYAEYEKQKSIIP